MSGINKEIKKLGWVATISDQTDNVVWLTFNADNVNKFPGCEVVLTQTELTVSPGTGETSSIVNIGDIIFDYTKNDNENVERKATVTLRQIGTNEIHVYTFVQVKNELSFVSYSDFNCTYEYNYIPNPSTDNHINGPTGGTVVVSSVIYDLVSNYVYTKEYKSGKREVYYFQYHEDSAGTKTLSSGTTMETLTPVEEDFSDYLEQVTRILKSQETPGFYGFSKTLYAKESEYSLSADNKTNIVSGSPKGVDFTVTVSRNPLTGTTRKFKITCANVTGDSITAIETGEGEIHPFAREFEYIQDKGYVADNRRFIFTFHTPELPLKADSENSYMRCSIMVASNFVLYLYLENGVTKYSIRSNNTPVSELTEFYVEGDRPYPQFDDDNLVRVKETCELYPAEASGTVCVGYSEGWVSACTEQKIIKQEDCSIVSEMTYTKSSEGTEADKNGCRCAMPNTSPNTGDSLVDLDPSYVFSSDTTSVTVSTSSTAELRIDSYSGCSGDGTSHGWYWYNESIETPACVNNKETIDGCACQKIDNKVKGDTYRYDVTYEFDFDYNLIENKRMDVIFNYSLGMASREYTINLGIPKNSISQIIRIERTLADS